MGTRYAGYLGGLHYTWSIFQMPKNKFKKKNFFLTNASINK